MSQCHDTGTNVITNNVITTDKISRAIKPATGAAEGRERVERTNCVTLGSPNLVAGSKVIIIPPQPMSPGCEMSLIHASIEFPPLASRCSASVADF